MKRKLALLVLPTLLAATACGNSGKDLKRKDGFAGTNPDNAIHHDYSIYTRNSDGSINRINYFQIKTNDAKSFYYANTTEYAADTNLKQDYTKTTFKEDGAVEQVHHTLLEKDSHGNDVKSLQEQIDPTTKRTLNVTENREYKNTYNPDGNLTETIETNKKTNETFEYKYSYDNSKRLTQYTCYLQPAVFKFGFQFQYLGATNLIRERKRYEGLEKDGSWKLSKTNTYNYNNNNLLINEIAVDYINNSIWQNNITIENKKSTSVQEESNITPLKFVKVQTEEKEYAEEYKSDNQKPIKTINTTYSGGKEDERTIYMYSYNGDNNILEDSIQNDKKINGNWEHNVYTKRTYQY